MSQPTTLAVAEPEAPIDGTAPPATGKLSPIGNRGSRVPPHRVLAILAAHEEGASPKDIATMFGSDPRTVGAVIRRHSTYDLRAEAARKLLDGNVLQFANDFIRASSKAAELGKHQAAERGLLYTKVLEPLEDKPQAQGVQIIIGMAGQPAGPDPLAGAKVASIAPSVGHDAQGEAVSG